MGEVTIGGMSPFIGEYVHVLYVFPLFIGLHEQPEMAFIHGWFLGIARDVLSISPFGTFAFIFATLALGMSLMRRYFYPDRFLKLLSLSVASQFVMCLLFVIVSFVVGGGINVLPGLSGFLSKMFVSSFFGSLLFCVFEESSLFVIQSGQQSEKPDTIDGKRNDVRDELKRIPYNQVQ